MALIMNIKVNELNKNSISIISKDSYIKGELHSTGSLDVEGNIEGDIFGNIITIREEGEINGNITAKILNLKGKFNGKIKSERINISTKADIKGTLEYVSLCVEDGAKIEGELKKINEVKFDILEKKNSKQEEKVEEKENKNLKK